jgi:hypothetical protein
MFVGLGCGCLLAMGIGLAPRLFLILAWIFSDRWDRVWGSDWLVPLLGIIFLPYTTVMYMLIWTPAGIESWDWLWIILGLMLDIMKWAQLYQERRGIPGYPGGHEYATSSTYPSSPAGGSSTSASVSGGQARSATAGTTGTPPPPSADAPQPPATTDQGSQ